MVSEDGQLYTMEGIAAGLIMLLTAYLVLGSTSVYTPGDTHITDMQLEQVGSDILRVMDTPRELTGSLQPARSDLELMVNATNANGFYASYLDGYLCRTQEPLAVAKDISVGCKDIQLNASVWYVGKSSSPGSYLLPNPNAGSYSGLGPGVRVTHWIHTNWKPGGAVPSDMRTEPQELLLEVLMWKA
jgi:hypothetical protein